MSERRNIDNHRKRIQDLIIGKERSKRSKITYTTPNNERTTNITNNESTSINNEHTSTNSERTSPNTGEGIRTRTDCLIKRWVPNEKIEGIYQIFKLFKDEIFN